jgi:hypothetical protein
MAAGNTARTAKTEGQNGEGTAEAAQKDASRRERSSIAFPYNDLADAIGVAKAIHENVGAGDCDDIQLAAWMKQSRKSSGFRVQLSAARMFGVLDPNSDRYKLSPLGRAVVDSKQETAAKVDAFLKVPLYRAIYEKYKDTVLPPTPALESDLVGLGVAGKQKGRARQVFERSAEQAGFAEQGKDRLVRPGVAPLRETDPDPSLPNGGGGGKMPPLHPLIRGLIEVLPHNGKTWTATEATEWLQTAASNFRYAYRFNGKIKVELEKDEASA